MRILFLASTLLMLCMSSVTFFIYRLDKRASKRARARRVPEHTLLLLAFFFGAPGALCAMASLRHKTQHIRFALLVPLFALLQIAGLIYFGLAARFPC